MQRSWIGWVSNSVTFDVKPLDTLHAEKGSEGSCNWVWVVQREIDDDPSTVAVLQQPLSNRRKRIDLTGAMLNLAHRCCLIASLPVNTATIPPPRCAWSRDSVTPLEAEDCSTTSNCRCLPFSSGSTATARSRNIATLQR